MVKFEHIFNELLENANIAGGSSSVFGTVDSGSTGNQFPAQSGSGYNPGNNMPADPASLVLGAKKKKGKKRKIKFARRAAVSM